MNEARPHFYQYFALARYFLPLNGGAPGLGTKFIPGESEEDFIEKNKDLKQILEDRNAWPHTEPY